MRFKLITPGFKMAYGLCLVVLPGFLFTPASAANKNFYTNYDNPLFITGNDFLDVTVSGKISDEQGNGMVGVNILEKSTTRGTVSDASGKFSLKG